MLLATPSQTTQLFCLIISLVSVSVIYKVWVSQGRGICTLVFFQEGSDSVYLLNSV